MNVEKHFTYFTCRSQNTEKKSPWKKVKKNLLCNSCCWIRVARQFSDLSATVVSIWTVLSLIAKCAYPFHSWKDFVSKLDSYFINVLDRHFSIGQISSFLSVKSDIWQPWVENLSLESCVQSVQSNLPKPISKSREDILRNEGWQERTKRLRQTIYLRDFF